MVNLKVSCCVTRNITIISGWHKSIKVTSATIRDLCVDRIGMSSLTYTECDKVCEIKWWQHVRAWTVLQTLVEAFDRKLIHWTFFLSRTSMYVYIPPWVLPLTQMQTELWPLGATLVITALSAYLFLNKRDYYDDRQKRLTETCYFWQMLFVMWH